MSDGNEQKDAPSGRKPLTLTRTTATGTVRQSFSHGRTKQVAVEVREKRAINRPGAGGAAPAAAGPGVPPPLRRAAAAPATQAEPPKPQAPAGKGGISDEEARRRDEAVRRAMAEREAREQRQRAEDEQRRALEDAQRRKAAEQAAVEAEAEARRRAEAEEEERATAAVAQAEQRAAAPAATAAPRQANAAPQQRSESAGLLDELGGRIKSARKPMPAAPAKPAKKGEPERRKGKLTLDMVERQVAGDDDRVRSLAAYRRAQQKEKERRAKMMGGSGEREQIKREVIIPESITVQDLANRMAIRVADIIKFMMRQGQMVKQADELDADTAELIATEFGHAVKRVAESDVEEGLAGDVLDTDENLKPRPPVVTVMGHVDHGKTSLLDSLRQTDVAAGEAGGITQHIGAYQVRLADGQRVTFIDTPGHAAFTSMRARGAQVTDIVVLVVAADDGVMPQTVEAINHARAAGAPIIVAINKIDKEDANPTRVLTDLLQHEIVTEAHGGDTLAVEVSATKKIGLEKLVETILLQAEVMDLKANPDRPAEATVIESKLDRGRGTVATVLVQKGTLKRGDIVVVGAQMGRIRALTNERGQQLPSAGPSEPVEIMGLEGVPDPGDTLNVVENENRAREVADYRARAKKQKTTGGASRTGTSLESMMAKFKDSTAKELPILIKADVQGSAEAIVGSLDKLAHEEVRARVVLSGVGAINESDVQLAKTSGAPLIGFNVRASKEARDLAEREGVEIRYYAIIYDLIDDIKGVMSGMLAPQTRETFLGNAQVLEVFNISKVGKVAGCRVTDGVVRKGAKVRILRDNVVIQEMGVLTTLKRFKDEVNEVVAGQECGMSFGPFQDIKQGDVIECFNVEVVQRSL
ncbi:MAG: translation initiation factor IF-2 [Hyphomonadaceae bacterium]|nr:translation initiation factor IF-2 [Hyphomonadaceae bacterium]